MEANNIWTKRLLVLFTCIDSFMIIIFVGKTIMDMLFVLTYETLISWTKYCGQVCMEKLELVCVIR